MTQEEKAKAYDEALERARKCLDENRDTCFVRPDIIFHELAESEDEKIRKALMWFVERFPYDRLDNNGVSAKEALAWLEKQGEQNSIDKVELKFHEGDFIKHNKANIICKVISVNSGSYYVENIETSGGIELFNAEQNFHLWTIQEAKNGDVLVYSNSSVEIILLFKNWMNGVGEGAYSYAHTFNNKILFNDWSDCDYTAHPATKEQRDYLFKKMHEEGYEWDAEKKELKKIVTLRERYKNIAESEWFKRTHEDMSVLDELEMTLSVSEDVYLRSNLEKLIKELKKEKQQWKS